MTIQQAERKLVIYRRMARCLRDAGDARKAAIVDERAGEVRDFLSKEEA